LKTKLYQLGQEQSIKPDRVVRYAYLTLVLLPINSKVEMALETETFHLNIGIGDCTIVCLKEFHPPRALPVLHKVVLIDGGKPHQAAIISKFLTV
jgi:hypothetical protein